MLTTSCGTHDYTTFPALLEAGSSAVATVYKRPWPVTLNCVVVDQVSATRTALRRRLMDDGHRVTEASDVASLVQLLSLDMGQSYHTSSSHVPMQSSMKENTLFDVAESSHTTSRHVVSYDAILISVDILHSKPVEAVLHTRSAGYRGLIVGLADKPSGTDMSDYLQHGFDRVLTQPLDVKQLRALVMEHSWV